MTGMNAMYKKDFSALKKPSCLVGANAQAIDAAHSTGAALLEAAHHGDEAVIERLLALGADVHFSAAGFGRTALHVAAGENHAGACQRLVAAGADLNARDREGSTALFYAVTRGCTNAAATLLAMGADLRASGNEALLHDAAYKGDAALCKLLVNAGAELDRVDEGGQTALHRAAAFGRAQACQALIAAGACTDARVKGNDRYAGKTAPELAALMGHAALAGQIRAMASSRKAARALEDMLREAIAPGMRRQLAGSP